MIPSRPNGRLPSPTAPRLAPTPVEAQSAPATPHILRAHPEGWALQVGRDEPVFVTRHKATARNRALRRAAQENSCLRIRTRRGRLVEIVDFRDGRREAVR
jgi:hypothetical protein